MQYENTVARTVRILSAAAVTVLLCALAALSQRETQTVDPPQPAETQGASPRQTRGFSLRIVDDDTGRDMPARFSLLVDGEPFVPESFGEHGLRFVSIHEAKQQVATVLYSRGTGPVTFDLPASSNTVEVHAARGFEYLPASGRREFGNSQSQSDGELTLRLRRWIALDKQGWFACDEHVHYDRLSKDVDRDWLTILAGDGLSHAHFMVLKGGKVPGIWARQYAYGKRGEANGGRRWIRSGEEYRDSAMGHINLLGLDEVIPPISTGGMGRPKVPENSPPLYDVLRRTRELNGLAGVAHGSSLGREPTAIVDTVLGAVDFFEIGNAHLFYPDVWYRLLSCGYDIPPAAGTDLPNYPFREHWQPFLGSMRMYVRLGEKRGFAAWKRAVKNGRVFVTSGPVVAFRVNGQAAGETIRLPATGGEVTIEAKLSSPRELVSFELIRNGRPVSCDAMHSRTEGIHRLRIRRKLNVSESCWLAVRGEGRTIPAMAKSVRKGRTGIKAEEVAHSGVVRVFVDDEPIRSADDARALIETLRQRQAYYQNNGRYKRAEDRLRMLDLFERAVAELRRRIPDGE